MKVTVRWGRRVPVPGVQYAMNDVDVTAEKEVRDDAHPGEVAEAIYKDLQEIMDPLIEIPEDAPAPPPARGSGGAPPRRGGRPPARGGRSGGGRRHDGPKPMKSRYDSTCDGCGGEIRAGEDILWDGDNRKVYHPECFPG